ncbi:hypothetical protein E2R62_13035 [Citrobacter rodentium]|uniref:Uncharacterized protein n=1 Tax=Citrobacter rodentium TaxID=67825 RepID=A0A482PI21_CITRO|nr:hypothetical protein E2R62_13035 [Citrobacter rodentium]HAT8013187.1 hypothetical protein [Citrobacter rodentium NBRC 105723 = DSM 16636]HAT8018329.1 hypothetical protein [Citrobacter rodentium]HAT8027794.1 hypothetical protein [Citrobacter rodentium]HAT8033060.1 hypothetical protein [Citrobacter rodentium]
MHTISVTNRSRVNIRNIWVGVCFSIPIVGFLLSRGSALSVFSRVEIRDIQEKKCHISVSYAG